jgi:glycerophosphoryl diester phosphodiesterase
MEDRTEIVAYRGSSKSAPKNTLAVVEKAISDGAHWVEIDVQRTADSQIVVIHVTTGLLILGESQHADPKTDGK